MIYYQKKSTRSLFMKTAAKIFTIIGIICEFWLIYPLVIGILAINKMDSATSKDELTVLGICNLLFCSTLGGLFMLMIKDEELQANIQYVQVEQPEESYQPEEAQPTQTDIDNVDLLERYKNLLDKGIISEEEYNQKKEEILKSID